MNLILKGLANQLNSKCFIIQHNYLNKLELIDLTSGNTSTTQSYFYDLNGNMTYDGDKGIIGIYYNYLNKSDSIDFGDGNKIKYIYDATGIKLAKKVMDGNAILDGSSYYLGNFVYDWAKNLQYILTSEGRLVPTGNTYRYEYFMKDHLGNTRATYAAAAPGLPQVMEYQHYYPFGMQLEALGYTSGNDLKNNYLYNGKELQEDYNLNWYDYGARFYDPEIGRWMTPDPLCEVNRKWSPYRYAYDNPLRFIDSDGMLEGDFYNKRGRKIGTDGIDDKKIHIVYNNKEAKSISSNTKNDKTTDASTIKDKVTLNGGTETVNGVVASVNGEENNTSTTSNDAGLHEEGGHTEKTEGGDIKPVKWASGAKKTGTNHASLTPFGGVTKPSAGNLLDMWHVHTSGTTEGTDAYGNVTEAHAKPGPSPDDKNYQEDPSNGVSNSTAIQVDTYGTYRVNFYNSGGVIFSMPLSSFRKIGQP